jgi:hypothetical protein
MTALLSVPAFWSSLQSYRIYGGQIPQSFLKITAKKADG